LGYGRLAETIMKYLEGLNWRRVLIVLLGICGSINLIEPNIVNLFGQHVADLTINVAAILVFVLTAIGLQQVGQRQTVLAVAAMPGVEGIETNKQANATLQSIADDKDVPKVNSLEKKS
jgi:hypothetical protein